MYYHKDFHYN